MAIAGYLVHWRTTTHNGQPARKLAINDFIAPQQAGQPERYAVVELTNNLALVKCNVTTTEQSAMDGTGAEFFRFGRNALSGTLGNLNNAQKNTLRTALVNRGWTLAEIQAALGSDFAGTTLRDLLRLICEKRDGRVHPEGIDELIDRLEAQVR